MKNVGTAIFATVVLVVIFAGVGLILGVLYAIPVNKGIHTKWENISDLPEDIQGLLYGNFNELYVVTVTDTIYHWDRIRAINGVVVWSETEFTQPLENDFYEIPPPDFLVSNPPDKEIERISFGQQWQHGIARIDYVLLENGQIWMWMHGTSIAILPWYAFIGLLFGVFIGLVISVVVIINRRRNHSLLT